MAKLILMEEFHVTIRAPAGLPETTYLRARRALSSRRFQLRLRNAVDKVFRGHPSLKPLKLHISS